MCVCAVYYRIPCTAHEVYHLGLARTKCMQCIYGIFGREITKYTVIYGVYIRFWPTLSISLPLFIFWCERWQISHETVVNYILIYYLWGAVQGRYKIYCLKLRSERSSDRDVSMLSCSSNAAAAAMTCTGAHTHTLTNSSTLAHTHTYTHTHTRAHTHTHARANKHTESRTTL